MITKSQAVALGLQGYGEVHEGQCRMTVGRRGGKKEYIIRWRVNGKCKIWKTKPLEFRLPIKWGLRVHSYITHSNAEQFHLSTSCPLEGVHNA